MARRFLLAALALVVVSGCGKSLTEVGDDTGPVSLTVQVSLGAFPIDEVVVEVSGPGIATPLAFNLTLASGVATGTIEVPAGSERTITVTAFDAAGVATHRGAVTIPVEEGDNPSVTVTLEALQGDQPIEAHIGTVTITVEPSEATLEVGDTLRLKATVVGPGDDTLDVQVRWATLNPSKAWVDVAGLVTAHGAGEVGIVATYAGVGDEARLHISVTPPVLLTNDESEFIALTGASLEVSFPSPRDLTTAPYTEGRITLRDEYDTNNRIGDETSLLPGERVHGQQHRPPH